MKKGVTVETKANLIDIVREVGEKYGFVHVKAEFAAFKELKIKWKRGSTHVDFTVSDYLEDAPDDVVNGLFGYLFAKMVG